MNKFNLKDKVAIKSQQTIAIVQSINFIGTDKGVFYELCSENGHHFYDAYEDDLELVKKYLPHSPWTDNKKATLKRTMDKNNEIDDELLHNTTEDDAVELSSSNNYHWICPNCNSKVGFIQQMQSLFDPDQNNEAEFNPKSGIYFHTIECQCGKQWIISMSGMMDHFEELL